MMIKGIEKKIFIFFVALVFCFSVAGSVYSQHKNRSGQLKTVLEGKTKEGEAVREKKDIEEKEKRQARRKEEKALTEKKLAIEKVNLPEDDTPKLSVKEIIINGNTLISTSELVEDIPAIYNRSDSPIGQARSQDLYDFRVLNNIIINPGQSQEVSTRTIQGFTEYLLSLYQRKNYSGIYVHVPKHALLEGMKLKDDVLLIEIIEVPVSEVKINFYDIEHNKKRKGYLSSSVVRQWSPIKVGEVANSKKMDDFINLLNLNPDRYVSATVSKGIEPQSITIGYDIYEINPWHYFVQVDNAGTDDRQWAPKVGVINTNLTGRDDTLTAVTQFPIDGQNIKENYSVYGSYDFPLWSQKLRLNLYGGYTEFDVDAGGDIDFLGNGSFYGGTLRYNAFQTKGWFFDVLGSLAREESKVTPSLFPQYFGSDVYWYLWSVGLDVHRRNDISKTSFIFTRSESISGSSSKEFGFARTGADPDFTILNFTGYHSRYLDSNKVHRVLGSLRYIRPDGRLVPAKMTTFGGMYTVRGYEESGIVADGGYIGSIQYEYDLIRKEEIEEGPTKKPKDSQLWIKKLAPLAFFDWGRAKIKSPLAGEKGAEELYSIGLGLLVEIGEHFNGAIYYGVPLRTTAIDDKGENGRLNINLMMRW